MKRLFGLFFIAACLSAHSQENNLAGVLSDTSRVIIFQADSLRGTSPSKEDLAIAEIVLSKALEIEFDKRWGDIKPRKKKPKQKAISLKRYYIQIIPRRNADGELEIWVNCFCSRGFHFDWRNEIFSRHLVADGGSCYFELTINIKKKTYHGFGMNGVA